MTRERADREEKTLRRRLAANLRRLREARDLTQEELAHRANLHSSLLQRVEAGELNTTIRTICRLAAGLDVGAVELLSDSGRATVAE